MCYVVNNKMFIKDVSSVGFTRTFGSVHIVLLQPCLDCVVYVHIWLDVLWLAYNRHVVPGNDLLL